MARRKSTERLIPFDVLPRIMAPSGMGHCCKRGLEQRVRTLNAYLKDIYGAREILRAGIVPEDLVFPESGIPAGDERPGRAARHLRPHRRHRHRARRCRHVPRAGGQRPHAFRRLLHAGEPRDHDAAVSRPVVAPPRRAGGELSERIADHACSRWRRRRRRTSRPLCCSRRASSIRPTTNTRSSPTSSASNSSKAAICWSRTTSSTCAPPRG